MKNRNHFSRRMFTVLEICLWIRLRDINTFLSIEIDFPILMNRRKDTKGSHVAPKVDQTSGLDWSNILSTSRQNSTSFFSTENGSLSESITIKFIVRNQNSTRNWQSLLKFGHLGEVWCKIRCLMSVCRPYHLTWNFGGGSTKLPLKFECNREIFRYWEVFHCWEFSFYIENF